MALHGSTWWPPARQLDRDNSIVKENIEKTVKRRDFEKTVKAQLEQKHAQRRQKILVVANRLPTTAKCTSEGEWQFTRASGGLVSCLSGIAGYFEMVWIGWLGADIPEADQAMVAEKAQAQNWYPVFLPENLINDYYNGFANNVLWPLLHYIMPPFDNGVNECSTAQWEAYRLANEKFVEAILEVYEDDDYVWVHDYHLMLVPGMLRGRKPDCNIGWFLHTPFPSAEVYRTLPWRTEIIESLLHANLLGFHVYDYLRHFLSSCVQLTSLEISAHTVDATSIGGCIVTCATVPIGISPQDFTKSLDIDEVQEQIRTLKEQYGERRVILGIDRLDYMKGIPHKLMAYDCFLENHPDWVGQCVLVQLAVPSRRDVPEYQRLMRQTHELVGQICGRHTRLEVGAPVIYIDKSMSHNDLVALYHVADVALITSLRDGMNLVSYEYIACHKGKDPPGVLVLSEFAGAAQSLGAGSVRINPWNVQETADAIFYALQLPDQERRALHEYAFNYITEHTAEKWAETFLQCLQEASSDSIEVTAEVPPLLPFEDLLTDWSESTRRLIILDLLECLAPPKRQALSRTRGRVKYKMPEDLKQCLRTIADHPDTMVVITADKSRNVLETTAGDLPVILAPEGSCVCRKPGGEWRRLVEDANQSTEGFRSSREDWMDGVEAVFNYFVERTPGSNIEKQESLIRWYWEDTQTDFGSAQAREVLIHLWAGPLVNSEAEVVVGDASITVRPHDCSRSACLERLLQEELGEENLQKVDFALCYAVVSRRDEDVFETLVNLLGSPVEGHEGPDVAGSLGTLPGCVSPTLGVSSPRPISSPGEPLLRTPPGPAPMPSPGEFPPAYDWIPTAQREQNHWQLVSDTSRAGPDMLSAFELPSAVDSTPEASYCSCYTLSLGMRKTKAQHMLPTPYHVQNLIRAMAARLPQRQESEA